MRQILTGGQIFSKDGFLRGDLVIEDGIVSEIGAGDASGGNPVVSKDNFIRCNELCTKKLPPVRETFWEIDNSPSTVNIF